MGEKRVTIVAGSMNTARALRDQLAEYLDVNSMRLLAVEEGISAPVEDQVVLLSSELTREDLRQLGCYSEDCVTIVAGRTVNYDYIDQIVAIPSGTEVVLVNDLMATAEDVIENLRSIGLDHLQYVPYCPGGPLPPDNIKVAITPGESDKVPDSVELIYDIGPRLLDFVTVTQVLMATSESDRDGQAARYSHAYLEKIIRIAKRLAASHQEVESSRREVQALNAQLRRVIDGLKEGLLVYNEAGEIKVVNDYACQLLGIKQTAVLGRPIRAVLPHKALIDYLYGEVIDAEGAHGHHGASSGMVSVVSLDGMEVSVSRMVTSAMDVIVSFKRPDAILEEHRALQQELARKGFTAKYSFDDIVGESSLVQHAKRILAKLAKSELTILIHGESGTGKELFASAVHRASGRANGPFLAINFSALPDDLVESELFGYEDGAFTGARKGGKAGLFEQANGGTLFLDEIGDVSPKVQARLLRVLQEGEMMRIGAQEIKRVDVRVVAATNKDLEKKVQEGTFREDLYYRLKMGYVQLPPLRERLEDVPRLMVAILRQESLKPLRVTREVTDALMVHQWPGNVRELKNCLSYMVAVCEADTLTLEDLPETFKRLPMNHLCGGNDTRSLEALVDVENMTTGHLTDEEVFILKAISVFERQKEPCGREKLAAYSMGTPYALTKYQMRLRLERLEQEGYVTLGRGKVGVHLTGMGQKAIK